MRLSQRPLIVFIAIIALCFVIYANGIAGDFVQDDIVVIRDRGDVKDPSNFFNLFISPYHQNTPESGLFRPLTMASYSLNMMIFGLTPYSFHIINILLYALCAFLIFYFIKQFFESDVLAYTTTAIFLFHPIHTEAVTSIVGRAELMAFAGSMGAIMLFLKGRKFLAALVFLLALLSKETAIMALPILFYVLWAVRGESFKAVAKRFYVFIPPLVIYFLLRFIALGKYIFKDAVSGYVENPLKFESLAVRVFTAFKVLFMYVERLFWPVHLSADYSYNTIKLVKGLFESWQSVLGAGIFVLLIVLMVWGKTRKNALGIGAVIFFFPYLLISNLLFPIGTIMAERVIYFSSFGVALILAYILVKLMEQGRAYKLIVAILLIAVMIFWGALTISRNRDWLSNEALFNAAYAESPDGVITRSNLAALYIMKGQWDEAKKELESASSIYEDYTYTLHLRAIVAHHEGNLELAEQLYKKSIELGTNPIDQYINLSNLYIQQDRKKEAADVLLKIIEFYPTAKRLASYAYLEISIGEPDNAIGAIVKYSGERPSDGELNAALGTAYFVKKDYGTAIIYLERAQSMGINAKQVKAMLGISRYNLNI